MPNVTERLKAAEANIAKLQKQLDSTAASEKAAVEGNEQLAADLKVAQANAAENLKRAEEAEAKAASAEEAKAAAEEAKAAAEAAQEDFDQKVAAKAIDLAGNEDAVTDGDADKNLAEELTPEQASAQLAKITDPHKKAAFQKKHSKALLAAAAGAGSADSE